MLAVKIGGSVVTEAVDGRPVYDSQSTQFLAKAIFESREPLIIAHGTGTIGRAVLADYDTKTTLSLARESVAHDVQLTLRRLHNSVVRELRSQGIPVRSFDPESIFEIKRGVIVAAGLGVLERALRRGEVPLLSGGTYWAQEQLYGILSSDSILEYMAGQLDARRVVIATNVDGVLRESERAVIPELRSSNLREMWQQEYDRHDATGGMTAKVQVALRLAAAGRDVYIVNGRRPDAVRAAMRGQPTVGTVVKS